MSSAYIKESKMLVVVNKFRKINVKHIVSITTFSPMNKLEEKYVATIHMSNNKSFEVTQEELEKIEGNMK